MQQEKLGVLYNGTCPVCRTEVDHYADYCAARDLPIRFDDLTECDLKAWGVTADAAARRLHVRQGDLVLVGVPAFLALWAEMPRYRWLARLVGLPGVRQAAIAIYDGVLAPLLYRAHLRRQRQTGPGTT